MTGKFPDFPDEDEGGSALIFKNKSVKELENEISQMEVRKTSISHFEYANKMFDN